MSSPRMLSSFARATSCQPGAATGGQDGREVYCRLDDRWGNQSIPHSTQDEALHQAEKLLRKYGCGLEITLHLDDEISAPPAIWFNKKRMQQWCLAGFPAVRI
jgi:hypothetical protein